MQLTKNFRLEEFACHNGEQVPDEYRNNIQLLANNLQVLRDYIQKPIRILSGYRSPSYNSGIGGAKKSQHMLAKASDITISGMSPRKVAGIINMLINEGKMQQGGLGLYKTFVHYDVRPYKARWKGAGV